jgi:UDP-N-acetylglucosamine pyrophosphorylase
MVQEGISESAITAFESTFQSLTSGSTGLLLESEIRPVPSLDSSEQFAANGVVPDTSLLSRTVVLKLNGGLGTGMGLDQAKSLLVVASNGDTFLDLTAQQILALRREHGQNIKFMLMNSFSTSADTLSYLQQKYPGLAAEPGLEMMQNKVPKLEEQTLTVGIVMDILVCSTLFDSLRV